MYRDVNVVSLPRLTCCGVSWLLHQRLQHVGLRALVSVSHLGSVHPHIDVFATFDTFTHTAKCHMGCTDAHAHVLCASDALCSYLYGYTL
jgi:hypothetical protein